MPQIHGKKKNQRNLQKPNLLSSRTCSFLLEVTSMLFGFYNYFNLLEEKLHLKPMSTTYRDLSSVF